MATDQSDGSLDVSWAGEARGEQRETWSAKPGFGGILSSTKSSLQIGLDRNGGDGRPDARLIGFPIEPPPPGKRREIIGVEVVIKYVDRDLPVTERPGIP